MGSWGICPLTLVSLTEDFLLGCSIRSASGFYLHALVQTSIDMEESPQIEKQIAIDA